jgi:hypothetical protein
MIYARTDSQEQEGRNYPSVCCCSQQCRIGLVWQSSVRWCRADARIKKSLWVAPLVPHLFVSLASGWVVIVLGLPTPYCIPCKTMFHALCIMYKTYLWAGYHALRTAYYMPHTILCIHRMYYALLCTYVLCTALCTTHHILGTMCCCYVRTMHHVILLLTMLLWTRCCTLDVRYHEYDVLLHICVLCTMSYVRCVMCYV